MLGGQSFGRLFSFGRKDEKLIQSGKAAFPVAKSGVSGSNYLAGQQQQRLPVRTSSLPFRREPLIAGKSRFAEGRLARSGEVQDPQAEYSGQAGALRGRAVLKE
jgi:hypothetical protein